METELSHTIWVKLHKKRQFIVRGEPLEEDLRVWESQSDTLKEEFVIKWTPLAEIECFMTVQINSYADC